MNVCLMTLCHNISLTTTTSCQVMEQQRTWRVEVSSAVDPKLHTLISSFTFCRHKSLTMDVLPQGSRLIRFVKPVHFHGKPVTASKKWPFLWIILYLQLLSNVNVSPWNNSYIVFYRSDANDHATVAAQFLSGKWIINSTINPSNGQLRPIWKKSSVSQIGLRLTSIVVVL